MLRPLTGEIGRLGHWDVGKRDHGEPSVEFTGVSNERETMSPEETLGNQVKGTSDYLGRGKPMGVDTTPTSRRPGDGPPPVTPQGRRAQSRAEDGRVPPVIAHDRTGLVHGARAEEVETRVPTSTTIPPTHLTPFPRSDTSRTD